MPAATSEISLGPKEIARRILVLRGQRVILDADLARIYGVTTKRLNEQLKRNTRRFPEDFCFQLTRSELVSLRSQLATLNAQLTDKEAHAPNWAQFATGSGKHRGASYRPFAFTEHGAIQAANVPSSDAAIEMGVHVVRAFVRLRQWLGTQKAFATKLAELEARVGGHDEQLAAVIEALRQLTASPEPEHDRKMGFPRGNRRAHPFALAYT